MADAVVAASPLTEGAGEEVALKEALKEELNGLLGTGVIGAPIGLALGEVGAEDPGEDDGTASWDAIVLRGFLGVVEPYFASASDFILGTDKKMSRCFMLLTTSLALWKMNWPHPSRNELASPTTSTISASNSFSAAKKAFHRSSPIEPFVRRACKAALSSRKDKMR